MDASAVAEKKNEKKLISLRIKSDTIEYFREEAVKIGVPYQTLISMVLNCYAAEKISFEFKKTTTNKE